MICLSGYFKTQEEADRFLDFVERGATVVAHPRTLERLKSAGVEFREVMPNDLVDESKVYAVRTDLLKKGLPRLW